MKPTKRSGKTGATKRPVKGSPAVARSARAAVATRGKTSHEQQESEEKYKFLIEATSTGYVILDDSGRVLDANPEYVRMTGRAALKDILGRRVTDWTAPYDLERNAAEVAKCIETGSARNLVIDYVHATGAVVPVEINATVLPGPPARIFTVCRDITDRKQAERALADREVLLRQIMDTASVAIFLVDRAGRITHANKRMAEMFGRPHGELVGCEYVELVHPSEREIGRKKMLALLASEIAFVDLERRYWRKDGTEFWGHLAGRRFQDDRGSEIGLIGVIADVSEHRKAEDALRLSEERFRLLVETSYDWIWEVDAQGTYTYASPRVKDLLGYGPEEIVGKTPFDLMPSDERERVAEMFREIVRKREPLVALENINLHKDGRRVVLETSGLPVFDAAGAFRGYRGIDRDITERKHADASLRESENRTRSIIESIPVGMHMYRLEPDGRLVFTGANPAADRILGVDNSTFIGKTIEEAFPPLVQTEVPHRYREVVETGKPWQTESIEYKDNAIAGAFEVHAFRTGPDAMVAAFEVITERKRAEQSLKASESKYRRLYNETPIMLHSIDRNAVLVDVNDHWLKVMGYQRNEVIGRKVTDFYTADSAKYAMEVVQPEFFQSGVVKNIPYQFVKKNGEIIDVLLSATAERDRSGKVIRSLAVIEDITERKATQHQLAESQRMLRNVIDTIPVRVFWKDRDSRYLGCNSHFAQDAGRPNPDSLLGEDDFVMAWSEQAELYRADDREVMRTGISKINYEEPQTTPAGDRIWLRTSKIPLRDDNGTIYGILGTYEDITERKQIEEALQRSEKMLQTIIDTEPDCIKITDRESRVLMMNRAGLDMVEADSLEQVKGQFICPLVAPQYREAFLALTEQVFLGGSGTLEFLMTGMRGRQLWLETRAVPLQNEKDEIVALLGVTRDITERKRVEEETRRNEARMASLFRISQQLVTDEQAFLGFALNEAITLTGSAIGYLFSYDEAKREFNLNAYSRDVMKECSIADRKTCYELDRTGIWGEAVRQRKPIILNDFEAEHPLKKGYPEGHARLKRFLTVPVIMQGAVVAVVGVANKQEAYSDADTLQLNFLMDSVWKMVQRARAEEALRQSEERFRELADSLPLTVFEMDLQGRFSYVNRAAMEQFGFTPEDVAAGLTMPQVIAPEDRARALSIMQRRLAGNAEGYIEYRGMRKDGSVFPITVASSPIVRDGRPVGLRGIVTDLTVRKQLEDEQLKAQKLESIGTLAGGIAHDFNNLLQGVFGYLSLAKLTYDQRERSLAMLEQAEQALQRSVSLASQLLTFSKGGKPVKKVVALPPILESACRFALSGSRTTCRIETEPGIWNIEADAGQIGQVIQNIVLNADHAMPLGGMVVVRARNLPVDDASVQEGDRMKRVEITLRDTGIGIPAEYLPKIFDPYFTTKEKGSGLGLATSYSIIKNHGGAIAVASKPGLGATFTIVLPAADRQLDAAAPAPASVRARSGRVLVMDDDAVVRAVATELIRSLGHEVDVAENGEQAIERYRRAMDAGKPFDVVILDLTVRSGMGGVEAVRWLRKIDPNVKAVVSSGYSDDAVMANFHEHGFRMYLGKPYTADGLNDLLKALMG